MKDTVHLVIADGPGPERSRIGGNPPRFFETHEGSTYLGKRKYLLTISDECAELFGGQDLSIFLHSDFTPYGDAGSYPNMRVDCILHPPSPPSAHSVGRMEGLNEGRLVKPPQPFSEKDTAYLVKIGGKPTWVQEEPYYEEQLLADGFSFLMQVDEIGYPTGFIQEFLFGFGALYIYAKWNAEGQISQIVPGYIQF
jgi:hypothetical protein